MDRDPPGAAIEGPNECWLAETHEVLNQPAPLVDYNLYTTDRALQEAVAANGGAGGAQSLVAHGARLGTAATLALGDDANRHPPELETHDRYGHRVDLVRFHPAYHALMAMAIGEGLHAAPWSEPGPGAHVVRAAKFFMQSQVEAGHGCPVSMTFAGLRALRRQPGLARAWEPRLASRSYDPRNVADGLKPGVTLGMAMTEKQGGSDLRANATRAYPLGREGPGETYELVGHKFFMSAPMSDAFLTLANTRAGLTCFLLPRWRPDGSKNPAHLQRLKRKMGNVANATAEVEYRGALAWMVGAEGDGVRTVIDAVALTRFDCLVGSAAGMRAATAQALHHCRQRAAFGTRLVEQPLMQNVLADLVLESEAATALAMRVGRALDESAHDERETLLLRLGTILGKYWVCKRAPQHAAEALECVGGSGAMEDSPMARLFRESPINAVWEGSGNVQCLDLLRAMRKLPAAIDAYLAELGQAAGGNAEFDRCRASLATDLRRGDPAEFAARSLADRMALALQASLLLRHAPPAVADAFCRARLGGDGQRQFGTLPAGTDCAAIVARAMPE
jgi:putative acyl-CoA dehydrogenase